jgi:hypothetical protein
MKAKKKENNLFIWLGLMAAGGALLGLIKPSVSLDLKNENPDFVADIKSGLDEVSKNYGADFAKKIEQLLRLETNHFKSQQFKIGNTAGMEAQTLNFPFGWSSLNEYANEKNLDPDFFDTYPMKENGAGINKNFIAFPSPLYFIDFLSWFIQTKRGGDPGKWFSLNEAAAAGYNQAISKVKTYFT